MGNKLLIKDNLFVHAFSSSWYNKPDIFEWERHNFTLDNKIIITDENLYEVDIFKNNGYQVYAWLVESKAIKPHSYSYIYENHHKFDKIFTFDRYLLDIYPEKCIKIPIGGCWIKEEDRGLHTNDKSKLCSIIVSDKDNTLGHKFRHEIVRTIKEKNLPISIYGRGYNPIENKIEALKDYMFSIVIENIKEDYYFTEKIIDCFQTGVIPIYWGCPSIKEFFNENGILNFDSLDELLNLLEREVNIANFYDKSNFIEENFNKSKKYLVADNLIWNLLSE